MVIAAGIEASSRDASDFDVAPAGEHALSARAEFRWQLAILAGLAILRIFSVFALKIDSDETQHLHVAWGWAHGLVQYRDLFDNHTPLFHLLMAPFVAVLGERADILYWMRGVAMLIDAVALGAIGILGSRLFGNRVGLWAMLAAGAWPAYAEVSTQFRTDDMWVMFWALALMIWFAGTPSRGRAFGGGLLMGAAAAVSLKSTGMLFALLAGLAILPLAAPQLRRKEAIRAGLSLLGWSAAGIVVVPLAIAGFYAAIGAWQPFIYCTILHNIVPSNDYLHFSSRRGWHIIAAMAILFVAAREAARRPVIPGTGVRAAAVLLIGGLYYSLMEAVWPVLQAQTLLSLYPMLIFGFAAAYFLFASKVRDLRGPWRPRLSRIASLLPLAIVALELAFFGGDIFAKAVASPAESAATADTAGAAAEKENFESADPRSLELFLSDVLKLTGPADTVMDAKGESVFRRRPYYYVLERFTLDRLRHENLDGRISDAMIAAGTCVAVPNGKRYPAALNAFLARNFISVGRLLVAGQWLRGPATASDGYEFQTEFPARCRFVDEKGSLAGQLDGKPVDGAVLVPAGKHQFLPARALDSAAMVWAQAIDRGFSPYPIRKQQP